MDSSAVLHAYLNTALKQNYASMPYFSLPMLRQPSVIGQCLTHHAVSTPQAQPNVKALSKRMSFNIDSILAQKMADALSSASTLPTPSTPSSRPVPPTVKTRGAFTPAITKILRDWFYAHLDSPYLDDESTVMLIERTHLSKTQLMNWFTNRRRSYEKQHGHVKWVKKAAPACARMKRPAAQRDAAEPAKKMARVSTD